MGINQPVKFILLKSFLMPRFLRFLLITAITGALLTGCVPNRKYVYLQKNDLAKKDIPKDTTLRTYDVKLRDIKIQPQDVLSVRFESLSPSEFDFLKSQTQATTMNPQTIVLVGELVDPNGEINYPVIGKVKVSGLSVFEAQELLTKLASQFLEGPKVVVRVVNFRVTVLGEVRHEGSVPLQNNRASILEVIGLAGGFGDLADRSSVKVIRQSPTGVITVQYVDLLNESLVESPYYFVQQNDVIVVAPLKQRPFRTYVGPNVALFVSAASVVLLILNLTK